MKSPLRVMNGQVGSDTDSNPEEWKDPQVFEPSGGKWLLDEGVWMLPPWTGSSQSVHL